MPGKARSIIIQMLAMDRIRVAITPKRLDLNLLKYMAKNRVGIIKRQIICTPVETPSIRLTKTRSFGLLVSYHLIIAHIDTETNNIAIA